MAKKLQYEIEIVRDFHLTQQSDELWKNFCNLQIKFQSILYNNKYIVYNYVYVVEEIEQVWIVSVILIFGTNIHSFQTAQVAANIPPVRSVRPEPYSGKSAKYCCLQ